MSLEAGTAEDDAAWDGEGDGDVVADLPRPKMRMPAGALNVGAAANADTGGQLSTRRRFMSVGSFFSGQMSSRLTGGQVSSRGTTTAGVTNYKQAIETLNATALKESADIVAAAKTLLAFCSDHKKIIEACKHGALEAVAEALKSQMGTRDVVFVILPSLINLSSGDDEAGLKRVSTLIQSDVIETLAGILRSHPNDAALAIRAVWALQHVCRRGSSSTNPWLTRVLQSGVTGLVCRVHGAFPEYKALHTRAFFLLSSVCYHLTHSGVQAGMPSAATLDKTGARLSVIPAIAAALGTPSPSVVRDSEEVHEAAALALGDACASPEVVTLAVSSGVIEGLVAAMEAQPNAGALQENGCWAIRQLCERADAPTRARVAQSGAPRVIVHALLSVQWPRFTRLAGLREKGCRALLALCGPNPPPSAVDGAALEVRVQLAELGALEAACVALNSHPSEPGVVAYACDLLFAVCSGHDPNHRRKVQAADADAIPAIIESLKKAKGKKNSEHAIEAAYNALDLVAAGGQNLMDAAVALGYTPPEASLEA